MKPRDPLRLAGWARPWARTIALTALTTLATLSLALQSGGDPNMLRPRPGLKGRPLELPRGDVLLFTILQRFADYTGTTVYFGSDDPPQTTVRLERALEKLDFATARSVLGESGYDVSRETYRKKEVFWVQRAIVPPNRRGKIVRPGLDDAQDEPRPAGSRSSVRLYRMEEGGGPRYVVILETDSHGDAEDAVSILRARRDLRRPSESDR